MSGEIWTTPKTWGVENVHTGDFNRIEGNAAVLHRGNGQASLATAIAAESLTLPNDTDETFLLSAATGTEIKYIGTANRQPGNRIVLIVQTTSLISLCSYRLSPPSGYASIVACRNGVAGDWTLVPGRTEDDPHNGQAVLLHYSGTAWHCNV